MVLNKPSIFIYVNSPDEKILKSLLEGIEEGGVIFEIFQRADSNILSMSSEAAEASVLGVGVAVTDKSVSMHIKGTKKDNPVFYYEVADKDEARLVGTNSARAIKKLPFREKEISSAQADTPMTFLPEAKNMIPAASNVKPTVKEINIQKEMPKKTVAEPKGNRMKIYTKNGDQGMTSLMSPSRIPKSDERIEALGNIDELTSSLGLAKAIITDNTLVEKIERIQMTLINVMAGIASPGTKQYIVPISEITFLEEEIDAMEGSFERKKEFILPGKCELSARLDVARTVVRRAERSVISVDRRYGINANTKMYLNRLADYVYILARYIDNLFENGKMYTVSKSQMQGSADGNEAVKRVSEINLESASYLIKEIEKHAKEIGKKAVIAVCNAEGNPVAVHVMDDAFLVSYQVAVKKAYTAVAVKMPTVELAKLTRPGETFYGLQNLDGMVVFGGGVPLKINGEIVGGLGISGGTGEEDHALCEYGLSVFENLI